MTAYEYLKKQNADRLDYVAIESEAGNFTYCELFEMVDATAEALWKMGIKEGKKVLSMFPVLPHESFLFYGVDTVGAVLCQIAPQYTATEVCDFAKRIDVDIFFVFDPILTLEMEQMIYQNTKVRHIISVNFSPLQNRDERTIEWNAFIAMGQGVILPEISRDPDNLLFLASTGGSTGEPKSVMLNDNCFNFAVHQYLNSDVPYRAADRWMRLWPIFSASAAVANHHLPLCAGMRMLLRQFPIDITSFDRLVLDDKPNHLILIPQLLDILEHSKLLKNKDLSFITTAGCGGLALTVQFEKRVNHFMVSHKIDSFIGHGWGSTECAATGTCRINRETTRIGTVGVPTVNSIVAAFNPESGEELKYNEIGELCICSPNLMMGYYGDPDKTATVLRKHTDCTDLLHTGDHGAIDEDGIVTVKGRMSRVIFVFPTAKIYPQALESAVSKVTGVKEVVFCEIPDKEHDGFFLPVCFVVPNGICSADEVKSNVVHYCEEAFPDYSRPKHVIVKERFPLTKVGKPDVCALEKEAVQIK